MADLMQYVTTGEANAAMATNSMSRTSEQMDLLARYSRQTEEQTAQANREAAAAEALTRSTVNAQGQRIYANAREDPGFARMQLLASQPTLQTYNNPENYAFTSEFGQKYPEFAKEYYAATAGNSINSGGIINQGEMDPAQASQLAIEQAKVLAAQANMDASRAIYYSGATGNINKQGVDSVYAKYQSDVSAYQQSQRDYGTIRANILGMVQSSSGSGGNAYDIAMDTERTGGRIGPELMRKAINLGYVPGGAGLPIVQNPFNPLLQPGRFSNYANKNPNSYAMPQWEALKDVAPQQTPYTNLLGLSDAYAQNRPGYTPVGLLGDASTLLISTQIMQASSWAVQENRMLNISGMNISVGTPYDSRQATALALQFQLTAAQKTQGLRDDQFFVGELSKSAENVVERASSYHHVGMLLDIPVPANPLEYQSDLSVEYLKGTPQYTKDVFSPVSGTMGPQLPGMGLQDYAWNMAKGDGTPVDFTNATNFLFVKSAGEYGPYGKLYGGPNYVGTPSSEGLRMQPSFQYTSAIEGNAINAMALEGLYPAGVVDDGSLLDFRNAMTQSVTTLTNNGFVESQRLSPLGMYVTGLATTPYDNTFKDTISGRIETKTGVDLTPPQENMINYGYEVMSNDANRMFAAQDTQQSKRDAATGFGALIGAPDYLYEGAKRIQDRISVSGKSAYEWISTSELPGPLKETAIKGVEFTTAYLSAVPFVMSASATAEWAYNNPIDASEKSTETLGSMVSWTNRFFEPVGRRVSEIPGVSIISSSVETARQTPVASQIIATGIAASDYLYEHAQSMQERISEGGKFGRGWVSTSGLPGSVKGFANANVAGTTNLISAVPFVMSLPYATKWAYNNPSGVPGKALEIGGAMAIDMAKTEVESPGSLVGTLAGMKAGGMAMKAVTPNPFVYIKTTRFELPIEAPKGLPRTETVATGYKDFVLSETTNGIETWRNPETPTFTQKTAELPVRYAARYAGLTLDMNPRMTVGPLKTGEYYAGKRPLLGVGYEPGGNLMSAMPKNSIIRSVVETARQTPGASQIVRYIESRPEVVTGIWFGAESPRAFGASLQSRVNGAIDFLTNVKAENAMAKLAATETIISPSDAAFVKAIIELRDITSSHKGILKTAEALGEQTPVSMKPETFRALREYIDANSGDINLYGSIVGRTYLGEAGRTTLGDLDALIAAPKAQIHADAMWKIYLENEYGHGAYTVSTTERTFITQSGQRYSEITRVATSTDGRQLSTLATGASQITGKRITGTTEMGTHALDLHPIKELKYTTTIEGTKSKTIPPEDLMWGKQTIGRPPIGTVVVKRLGTEVVVETGGRIKDAFDTMAFAAKSAADAYLDPKLPTSYGQRLERSYNIIKDRLQNVDRTTHIEGYPKDITLDTFMQEFRNPLENPDVIRARADRLAREPVEIYYSGIPISPDEFAYKYISRVDDIKPPSRAMVVPISYYRPKGDDPYAPRTVIYSPVTQQQSPQNYTIGTYQPTTRAQAPQNYPAGTYQPTTQNYTIGTYQPTTRAQAPKNYPVDTYNPTSQNYPTGTYNPTSTNKPTSQNYPVGTYQPTTRATVPQSYAPSAPLPYQLHPQQKMISFPKEELPKGRTKLRRQKGKRFVEIFSFDVFKGMKVPERAYVKNYRTVPKRFAETFSFDMVNPVTGMQLPTKSHTGSLKRTKRQKISKRKRLW